MKQEVNHALPSVCGVNPSESYMKDKLTVYYDGSCPLCSVEIKHYASQKGSNGIAFVDVSVPEANVGPGLTSHEAIKRFHVRLPNGRLVSGARAFALIWEQLPRWHWAARLARVPGVIQVLEYAYKIFLPLRAQLSRFAARLGARALQSKTE